MYTTSKRKLTPSATPRKSKQLRFFSPGKLNRSKVVEGTPTNEVRTHTSVRATRKKALYYLENSQYKVGLRALVKLPRVQKALIEILPALMRKEMVSFLSPSNNCWVRSNATLENLEIFNWWEVFQQTKQLCPLMVASLSGALSVTKHPDFIRKGKTLTSVAPTVAIVTALLAFARRPSKANFFQQMNSMQMWLSGCKRELFPKFNHIGWSVGINATRRCIDKVISNYDVTVRKWMNAVEQTIMEETEMDNIEDFMEDRLAIPMELSPIKEGHKDVAEEAADLGGKMEFMQGTDVQSTSTSRHHEDDVEADDLDLTLGYIGGVPVQSTPSRTVPYKPQSSKRTDRVNKGGIIDSPLPHEDFCSYSLCFDNVNQKIGVRHQKKSNKPQVLNMVQLYAAKNRIPSLDLSNEDPVAQTLRDLPVSTFLPTVEDEEQLHEELQVLVQRILCDHLKVFNGMKSDIGLHIHHKYEKESSEKSEMVTLGVLEKDETKTAEMVDILREYHHYVPSDEKGRPLLIPLYGDGLSCERVADARGAVINCDTPWERLEGLEPCAQEWHKRVILLQDAFDCLYDGKSAKEKGTLFYLKQVFAHRKVAKEVKAEFNHNWEFFNFVTEGYVILAAMDQLGIKSMAGKPKTAYPSREERLQLLKQTSKAVVDLCFERQNVQAIVNSKVTKKDIKEYEFCVCKKDIAGSQMILCDNKHCPRGNWFHLECVSMDAEDIPEGDWYCCKTCEKSSNKTKKSPAALRCIDGKREYVRSVMWHGLNVLARRDAVRENDGNRIIRHWRFDMVPFFNNNHTKYFILGMKLLCQVSGGASPRIRQEVMWNRTVNTKGGQGQNIAMDLQMEFFNREYKESSKDSVGQLTSKTIARHSRLVGTSKWIDDLYSLQVAQKRSHTTRKHSEADRSSDLREMIKVLQPENFFEAHPGRYFKTFHGFTHHVCSEIPKKTKARILKHREKMASNKELLDALINV